MAKKKRAKTDGNVARQDSGPVSLQVRFDPKVHRKLTETAEKLGISLNRLVVDMCTACTEVMIEGKLTKGPHTWYAQYAPGYVSFGRPGDLEWPISEAEREERAMNGEPDVAPKVNSEGFRWFYLDFTERANIHGVGEA